MKRIGLLSDTHSYLDPAIFKHFKECDEIWHAGDIGALEVFDRLKEFKPLRAVYGNIDAAIIRRVCPLHQRFMCEEVDVWITHIGGYPKRYAPSIREAIKINPPQLFISGHSHILKVMHDKELGLLHMNPGAVGKHGFHQIKTMLRFTIDGKKIKDLEVIELGKR
tara:strand:+ start:2758 stop:3252 length:495 start_codon:yes stop_codon:yes gene_type:complete